MMNIVITMGGLGNRFKRAGYTIPKYMIEVKGKSLFVWSMLSLQAFTNARYIFILRQEDNAASFIYEQCEMLGKKNISVVEIDHLTKGQAETAMFAQQYWDEDNELLIYNIDTFIEPGILRYEVIQGDGFIPCFNAEGDHWSFVKLSKEANAVEVCEKKRISEHCSIGAYYFKSCKLYKKLYQIYYHGGQNLVQGEEYIAPIYNLLIEQQGNVRIQNIPKEYVHVLGTPEELKAFENH